MGRKDTQQKTGPKVILIFFATARTLHRLGALCDQSSALCLLVFKRFKQVHRLAGAPGFEPGYAGIKTLCLTAWRRPNAEALG